MFAPRSPNGAPTQYLALLRQATICWRYTGVRLSQQLSRVPSFDHDNIKIYLVLYYLLE